MMNGMIDEVNDQVPFYLFQSKEAKETAKGIYETKGNVTFNLMIKDSRFNSDYIYDCETIQFSPETLPYYIDRLKVAYVKKLSTEYANQLQMMVQSTCTLEQILPVVRNGIHVDFDESRSRLTIMPEEYAKEHYEGIAERAINPSKKKGIHFKNFPELNSTFYGLQGGDLILVCAKSGHGKTALGLNISNDFSIDQNYTGYYVNAEMRDDELTMRIAAKRAVIPAQEVMSANFKEVNQEVALSKLAEEYDLMSVKNLILSRIPTLSISSIRRGYKRLTNAGKKPDYILVDYIGRMELERKDTSGLSEWQKMYQLSEDIKSLAVELDIPIIALAQLNDDGQIEGAKKMKNACDGVLFFEPTTEDDTRFMNRTQMDYANYKITKFKVRRNDNSKPIYINFVKKYQSITEVF